MDQKRIQAWWWHCQELDGSLRGKPAAEVLQRAGWARSVGGVKRDKMGPDGVFSNYFAAQKMENSPSGPSGPIFQALGPEGKKKGMLTTLPLAFGKLQATGDIRRIPFNTLRPEPPSGSEAPSAPADGGSHGESRRRSTKQRRTSGNNLATPDPTASTVRKAVRLESRF